MPAQTDARIAAESFARHRAAAHGFDTFPGPLPTTAQEAYAIQAEAIALWDRPIAGWKIGRISGELEACLGENRFLGPVFADTVWPAKLDEECDFPAIEGGFAALEAELVAVVDAPGERDDWTPEDVRAVIAGWHIAIEVAGSPLAPINDLGPLASTAGFGNNLGLILGPQVTLDDPDAVSCTSTIAGNTFGPRDAGMLPGGPLAAVAFALNRLARMGQEVPEGTLFSTGAVTGVHTVALGDSCTITFTPGGSLRCKVVPLHP